MTCIRNQGNDDSDKKYFNFLHLISIFRSNAQNVMLSRQKYPGKFLFETDIKLVN